MDDSFFQQRLANLRESRNVLANTRRVIRANRSDALGYFGKVCSELREHQETVQALKEMSTSLLLRISDGMSLLQTAVSTRDDQSHLALGDVSLQSEILCTSSPRDKCAGSFGRQPPSRPVGKSDFMRGPAKPSTAPKDDAALQPEAVSTIVEEESQETVVQSEDEKRNSDVKKVSSCSSSDADNSEVLNALITEQLLFQNEENGPGGLTGSVKNDLQETPGALLPSGELVALSRLTPMEKLSMLCTLINTLHFWENELLPEDSWRDIKPSSVYNLIAATRESQKRLFKLLSTSDDSRPALCCAAVGELVRAYPPEKLLPTVFLQVLLSESEDNRSQAAATLAAHQNEEAAGFWDMLMTFAGSLMDEHGCTAEQVGCVLLDFIAPTTGASGSAQDKEEARTALQVFIVSHICCRIMYRDCRSRTPNESCGSTSGARSSMQSKGDGSSHVEESSLKLQPVVKPNVATNKGLWSTVIGLAWKRKQKQ